MTWGRAENAAITETDPGFGQVTYTVRSMSGITYMSREVASDSNPAIVETIGQLFAEAVAAERDRTIAVGDGSNQPEGIYSASGLSSVAVDGALSYSKLVEIKYALARRYQRRARWVLNTTNLQRIVSLTDDNGQPIVREALVAGEPPRILGKPFSVQDDLPDSHVFYGDLSGYLWFDRQRMSIESTTTGGDTFKKHQVAIKVVERCDGKLSLPALFVKGTGITG
jgi:HK97 family phage major capsid protein